MPVLLRHTKTIKTVVAFHNSSCVEVELVNLTARWIVTQNKLGSSLWKLFGKGQALSKKILGRWLDERTVYHHLSGAAFRSNQQESATTSEVNWNNQTLVETSREKNIFYMKKSLQCHSSFPSSLKNMLHFWYNWCFITNNNLLRSHHCCCEINSHFSCPVITSKPRP